MRDFCERPPERGCPVHPELYANAFVEKMHAKGLFDAAMFENIKECIDLW